MPITLTRLAMWTILATLPLTLLPWLPDKKHDVWIVFAALLLNRLVGRWSNTLVLLPILLLWAVTSGRTLLDQTVFLSASPLNAVATVAQIQPQSERVRLRLISSEGKLIFPPVYALVSSQGMIQPFCVGQRWQMRLKLKAVHARLNEGGFDAQRFALANHTPLAGKIITSKLLDSRCSWRDRIIRSSREKYGSLPWQSTISALAFGERGDVSRELTQLLRETGTAHLMAISGMHIGLAASLGWGGARLLQLLFPAGWIGYRFPLVCGLLIALVYSWLSGGNPPAIRAMLALSVWSTLRLFGQNCTNWQVWGICIGLILFFDPLSVLSDSLWMSALAVAGLLVWYHWFPLPGRLRARRWLPVQLFHLQLGMFMLMMPLQVLIFHGISLSALLANLWAVPVITMLTVPLILCALLFSALTPVSQLLWWLADRTLAMVFVPLQSLPSGWLAVSQLALSFSIIAWLMVVGWRFHWWRASPVTMIALCVSLLCWRLNVARPEWRVDMLDVGHGLAVVISRQGEATVYDTGNRWPGGDVALSQILPWLSWQGLQVKHIILSHEHLDHTGGYKSLRAAFPHAIVHSGLAESGHVACYRGTGWNWQGLTFQALWPLEGESKAGNNQSCVILVSDGRWRVLLTGDIEAQAERQLVSLGREQLRAEVIQVPHHGSGTSSLPLLLRAVAGQVALASAARYNAWKLPAKRIIARYGDNQYQWRDTAQSGQLSMHFFKENWQLMGLREQIMPRWYHQWFGVPRDSR